MLTSGFYTTHVPGAWIVLKGCYIVHVILCNSLLLSLPHYFQCGFLVRYLVLDIIQLLSYRRSLCAHYCLPRSGDQCGIMPRVYASCNEHSLQPWETGIVFRKQHSRRFFWFTQAMGNFDFCYWREGLRCPFGSVVSCCPEWKIVYTAAYYPEKPLRTE